MPEQAIATIEWTALIWEGAFLLGLAGYIGEAILKRLGW